MATVAAGYRSAEPIRGFRDDQHAAHAALLTYSGLGKTPASQGGGSKMSCNQPRALCTSGATQARQGDCTPPRATSEARVKELMRTESNPTPSKMQKSTENDVPTRKAYLLTPRLPKPAAGKRCRLVWPDATEVLAKMDVGVDAIEGDNTKATHESAGAHTSSSNLRDMREVACGVASDFATAYRRRDTSKNRMRANSYCHFCTPQEQLDEDIVECLRGQLSSYEAMLRLVSDDRYTLEERCKRAEVERDVLQELFSRKRQEFETLSKRSAETEDKLSSCTARLTAAEAEKQALSAQCEDQGKCVICLDGFADHVAIPCGHLAVCNDCSAAAATQCPVCRQSVESIVQVFRP